MWCFKIQLNCFDRSTPVESLHTTLLGACKYMLREFMESLTVAQRKEILTRVSTFPYYHSQKGSSAQLV